METIGFWLGNHRFPPWKPLVSAVETIGFLFEYERKPSVSYLNMSGNHRFPPQETAVLGQKSAVWSTPANTENYRSVMFKK